MEEQTASPQNIYQSPQPEDVSGAATEKTLGTPQSVGEGDIPPVDYSLGEEPPSSSGGIMRIVIIAIFALAVVVGIILLIGLFRKGDSESGKTSGPVTLTYWGLWEDENTIKPLINEYVQSHPKVTINYSLQSPKQYRERLAAALSRGGEVDIFRYHNTWVPMLRDELSQLPEDVMAKTEYELTFYPVARTDLSVNGKYVGIPLMIDGLALYYNEDILAASGKKVPTSWDELQQTAIDLTVKDLNGEIKTAGIALGTVGNVEHFSDILGLMLLQNGADLKNPSGVEASEALAYYRLFAEEPNNTWDEAQPSSIAAFSSGKVAMIFAPSWQAFEIAARNPKLKFKAAVVPQLPGGDVTWASYWVEGVSNKSQKQKEAWEFLKFLSSRESLVKLYTQESKLRIFGEPYSRTDLANELTSHPILGAYIVQAPQAQSFSLASRTFDNGINDRLIKYLEDAVNSLSSGNSPEGAMETAAQGFSQVLSQYGVIAPGAASTVNP